MSNINNSTIELCKQTKNTIRNTNRIIESIKINRMFDPAWKCARTGKYCEWKNLETCKGCDIIEG